MLHQQPLFNLRPEPPAAHSLGWLWKARLHLPRRHGNAADLVGQAKFARDFQLGEVGGGHFDLASSLATKVVRGPPMGSTLTGLRLSSLFSVAAPGAIRAKERLQDVRYQFCGFDGLVVAPAVLGRIGIELFLEGFSEHHTDRHRTLSRQRTKFQISHGFTSPISPCLRPGLSAAGFIHRCTAGTAPVRNPVRPAGSASECERLDRG